MKKNNQDKKVPRGLFETLSFRVFVIILVLLIIPLILHNVFLFQHEYSHRKRDVFSALQLLGESRILFINQSFDDQFTLLTEAIGQFKMESGSKEDFLNNIKDEIAPMQISYFSIGKDQSLICRASTIDKMIGKDYSSSLALQGAMTKDQDIIAIREKDGNYWLHASITSYSEETHNPIGIWTAARNTSYYVQRIVGSKNFDYPMNMTLIKDGVVIGSSRENFLGKKLVRSNSKLEPKEVPLIKLKQFHDAYDLEAKDVNSFATILPLKWPGFSLLLDVRKRNITNISLQSYIYRIGSLLFFLIVIGGGLSIWLIKRIARPMISLCETMQKVAEGDIFARYHEDRMGFEINLLGNNFNKMVDEMIKHQKEAQVERLEKQNLEQELKIGHMIQRKMLPKQLLDYPGLDVASGYLPAKEVGGDFYDLYKTPKGKLALTIADTSGKGISACMYSLTLRSIMRAFTSSLEEIPEMIKKTNNLFIQDTEGSGMFVTAWVGLYDEKTKTLEYTSAGHYPTLLRKENGEIIELNTSGIALGVAEGKVETQTVTLEKNDVLFLYTDGVIDAMNPQDEFFGSKRLKEFLINCHSLPAKQIVKSLQNEIKHFCDKTMQYDDITILVFRLF